MREFYKSLLSFSWIMSLFGAQQTANLLSPGKATKAFDSITEATKDQLCDALKASFTAGDKLQRQVTDMTLGLFTGATLNPDQWIRMASDIAQQSAQVVTQSVQSATSAVRETTSALTSQDSPNPGGSAANTGGRQSQGWGPVPS